MKLEELMTNMRESELETIELQLYETFCRIFEVSPMEMILKYEVRVNEKSD